MYGQKQKERLLLVYKINNNINPLFAQKDLKIIYVLHTYLCMYIRMTQAHTHTQQIKHVIKIQEVNRPF